MSTNLERERQRKKKAGDMLAKLNEKKKKREKRARARDKKQRGTFFVGRTTLKFCSGGEKMRNASSHQGENERQWKKK